MPKRKQQPAPAPASDIVWDQRAELQRKIDACTRREHDPEREDQASWVKLANYYRRQLRNDHKP